MNKHNLALLCSILSMSLALPCAGDHVSLTGGIYDPFSGNGNVSRSNLTYRFLTGSGTLSLMD